MKNIKLYIVSLTVTAACTAFVYGGCNGGSCSKGMRSENQLAMTNAGNMTKDSGNTMMNSNMGSQDMRAPRPAQNEMNSDMRMNDNTNNGMNKNMNNGVRMNSDMDNGMNRDKMVSADNTMMINKDTDSMNRMGSDVGTDERSGNMGKSAKMPSDENFDPSRMVSYEDYNEPRYNSLAVDSNDMGMMQSNAGLGQQQSGMNMAAPKPAQQGPNSGQSTMNSVQSGSMSGQQASRSVNQMPMGNQEIQGFDY